MEEAMPKILDWLSANWGWIVVILGGLIEFTPIKCNPLSAIFKWIGKRLNAETDKRIDALDEKFTEVDNHLNEIDGRLNKQEELIDTQRIANIRSLILDFANSCRNGRPHSHEEYLHIMSENGEYEKLVKKYNIINSVYAESYKYICNKYHECMENNSFLA